MLERLIQMYALECDAECAREICTPCVTRFGVFAVETLVCESFGVRGRGREDWLLYVVFGENSEGKSSSLAIFHSFKRKRPHIYQFKVPRMLCQVEGSKGIWYRLKQRTSGQTSSKSLTN